ncbi:MAG: hypothetical protein ACTHNW_06895 [Mucilaginibacter sp.]
MTDPVVFGLDSDGFERPIIITPVFNRLPGGELHPTGVFKLAEGSINMGEIVFDDEMKQWEYTGMGNLTHIEAAKIAKYIRGYDK